MEVLTKYIMEEKKNYTSVYTTIHKMDTAEVSLGTHLEIIFSRVGTKFIPQEPQINMKK